MKPTSTYNMSKQAKKFLATARTKEERTAIKKAFINAELSALMKPKVKEKDIKGANDE